MTNEITPPPALRQLWAQQAQRMNPRDPIAWQEHIANQASQWGANQELEACCEWLYMNGYNHVISARLRDARRPEPPSLKEQAFDALHGIHDQGPTPEQVAIIRRALEALDG
jgi:hypothetical protein